MTPLRKILVGGILTLSFLMSFTLNAAAATVTRAGVSTHTPWVRLVMRYRDWNWRWMVALAWCESRFEPWVSNPIAVYVGGHGWLHSTGLLGVLGGSTNPFVNVRQAHQLYHVYGYTPWAGDFSSGCIYSGGYADSFGL